jgi:hypothetical protein
MTNRTHVTDPKESIAETRSMTNAHRHIHRRRRAIDRLRALTTGAAVAGIAGTAGFGAVAAASWSGQPGAQSATDVGTGSSGESSNNGPTSPRANTNPSTNGVAPGDIFGSVPNSGTGGGTTRVRPAQPSTGRSHATSGGSR